MGTCVNTSSRTKPKDWNVPGAQFFYYVHRQTDELHLKPPPNASLREYDRYMRTVSNSDGAEEWVMLGANVTLTRNALPDVIQLYLMLEG
jgi:hypothetical protein